MPYIVSVGIEIEQAQASATEGKMAKGKRNEAAKAARAKRNESYRKGRKPRKLYEVNCYDKDACKGYDKLTCDHPNP